MLKRATQEGTSDIVFSCHLSLVFKGDSAASRRADLRAITLPPGLMRLHYSSSVDVCQPIRPIPTFVAAGISQFSCTRPGQYGLPVLGFAKPQFSTFVCEDLKSSDRFFRPAFVPLEKRITGEVGTSTHMDGFGVNQELRLSRMSQAEFFHPRM